MKTRTVTKLDPDDFPHDSFTGFNLPHSGEYVEALRRAFPPHALAALIEKLPPESRARLEKQFGTLPTTQKPQP